MTVKMSLFHVECPELGCINIFASGRDEAEALVKAFLDYNNLGDYKYTVGDAIDPMHLDRASREYLLGACARNTPGFGIFQEGYGWKIAPAWDQPGSDSVG